MSGKTFAERYHDISTGHRVLGHEGKCAHLHGHNYRFHFTCEASALDAIGRVIDFSVIKSTLCEWLEEHWDHKFLLSYEDPLYEVLGQLDPQGVVGVAFNPTAENMAAYMVNHIGPQILPSEVTLVRCRVEETRKCSATYEEDDLYE